MTQVIHDHSSHETVRQVPTVSQPDWIGWIASLAALSEGHEAESRISHNLLHRGRPLAIVQLMAVFRFTATFFREAG
jgi:hypothetical protein